MRTLVDVVELPARRRVETLDQMSELLRALHGDVERRVHGGELERGAELVRPGAGIAGGNVDGLAPVRQEPSHAEDRRARCGDVHAAHHHAPASAVLEEGPHRFGQQALAPRLAERSRELGPRLDRDRLANRAALREPDEGRHVEPHVVASAHGGRIEVHAGRAPWRPAGSDGLTQDGHGDGAQV